MMNLKPKSAEQVMFDEVAELLIADGWQKLTKDIDEQYVIVFTVYGDLVHRYITWEDDYSEWHMESYHYPCLWMTENKSIYDDVDDYSIPLVVSLKVPARTENTIKALDLLENFYEDGETNYD
jgi:hypothetical protein